MFVCQALSVLPVPRLSPSSVRFMFRQPRQASRRYTNPLAPEKRGSSTHQQRIPKPASTELSSFDNPPYYVVSNLVARDGSRFLWIPNEPARASCRAPKRCDAQEVAEPSCSCGIHAWRSESMALA